MRSKKPGYQTTIRHVEGERVTPIKESQSEKIGRKTHVYGHKRNEIGACHTGRRVNANSYSKICSYLNSE